MVVVGIVELTITVFPTLYNCMEDKLDDLGNKDRSRSWVNATTVMEVDPLVAEYPVKDGVPS